MTARDTVLITGGAGFIGTNLADRLLREGREVLVFDDLSRRGVERNLDWLFDQHPRDLTAQVADVRDSEAVAHAVSRASEIYHLAAQVAVTASLTHPANDFDINARGTLNVLEAMRRLGDPPPLLFTSTNKVYGALEDVALDTTDQRCMPSDATLRERGVDEHRPLEFHSPYGCSKGAAEQYVLDYARSFGLRTVVFRMSCIYGPHQHGNEDQGWVAHFMKRARAGGTLNVFGDGLQVRDLANACVLALETEQSDIALNIGSGNAYTIVEIAERLARVLGREDIEPEISGRYRAGDIRNCYADIGRATRSLGYRPSIDLDVGLAELAEWLAHSESEDHGAAAVSELEARGLVA